MHGGSQTKRGESAENPGEVSAGPGKVLAGFRASSAGLGKLSAGLGELPAGNFEDLADLAERRAGLSERRPVHISWSGGKDSAFALHSLRSSPDFEPVGLLTTLTEDYDRISIHGVRRELLEKQAESIGLPLHKVLIPKDCTNEIYEDRLATALREIKNQGMHHTALRDLFLEDIRA